MSEFVQGQRWVVDSEPELGLGIVTFAEGRTVRIFFEKGNCERTYASDIAPLTRIHYSVDDEITTTDGINGTVAAVQEHEGLYFYQLDGDSVVPETSLSSEIQVNQPFIRLVTGQIDKPNWFFFKRRLSEAMTRTWQSRLNGLLGIRANLIPHQLYVAHSGCEREKVRLLLADEVGLGKTIEAGMILSRLLKLERIKRALIVVPTALQVQWLVELVRRFAITPELYKEEEHDFHAGQIHIVSHEVLAAKRQDIIEGDFDIVIVDEAHNVTPESDAFATLSELSTALDHMVLLTATPEQLGLENHFARLKLLDPAKFTDIETFKAQEKQYMQLNHDIKNLAERRDEIIKTYALDVSEDDPEESIIEQLLDSHGVGRLMFRNARSGVAGFPERKLITHSMEDDSWESKFDWLGQWLNEHTDEKALIICHAIDDVFACETHLWKKFGIDAAVFHEEQSLIDRDKAAAYFSDTENGSQILVCSEIGSEGRNFQFCSHLICLDIPEHPDLMEQRIGRLDRIGQKRDVSIHVPVCDTSVASDHLAWFHDTLNCLEQQNPAAGTVHDQFWPDLKHDLKNATILGEAKKHLQKLQEEIKLGKDALLELNSCRQPAADQLAEKIAQFEKQSPQALVESASELLNFYFEETRSGMYSIIPSDKMLVQSLPGIPPEGCEITFSRDLANEREDIKFVSWDAPLIHGLYDLVQSSEIGTAAVAVLPSRQLPAGHCLLEACFDIVIQSEFSAACRPFLSAFSIRSLAIDISDNDLSQALPEDALQKSLQEVKRHLGREVIKSKKDDIPSWYKKCEAFAETQKSAVIEKAENDARDYFASEIARLELLKKRNTAIDEAEIDSLKEKSSHVVKALVEDTALHLSAVRLIVISEP